MVFPHKRRIKPRLGARINKGHRLAKGLVGYWLMNENPGKLGKVYDSSGNRHTGTLVGDTQGVPGKFGPALEFYGTPYNLSDTDCVVIPDHPSLHFNGLDFSISIFFKTNAAGSHPLIAKRDSVGTHDWALVVDDGVSPDVSMYLGESFGDTIFRALNASFPQGEWHRIVVTKSGTTYKLYRNGTYVGSDTSAQTWTDSDDIAIGAFQTDGNYGTKGIIDNVMIYNRALSTSEIAQLYTNPFGMFERDETILWQPGAGEPPVGNPGIMTTWGGYWGATY